MSFYASAFQMAKLISVNISNDYFISFKTMRVPIFLFILSVFETEQKQISNIDVISDFPRAESLADLFKLFMLPKY